MRAAKSAVRDFPFFFRAERGGTGVVSWVASVSSEEEEMIFIEGKDGLGGRSSEGVS